MGNYIPDTPLEQTEMLKKLGFSSYDDLYAMVPQEAKLKDLKLPEGKSEMEVSQIVSDIAGTNTVYRDIYRGAGAYKHYIPAIVKTITSNEKFLTAYTPYQAEISQGVLQSIFEYQTQICELTGMEVSNASVYDGAVAAAEAIFMCLERKRNEVLLSADIHPDVRKVIETYCESRSVTVTTLNSHDFRVCEKDLKEKLNEGTACVLVQSPNYYGVIEDVEALTAIVHEAGAKMIESVNPISLGLLKTPGEMGVDICVGEGQPLGLPLSFGGPYLGFMSCRKDMMRKLPGRIVGQTTDHDGRRCFVLTLQAREQHIRREKASSNICSNEALCAMTASVYLAAMGPDGIRKAAVASASHAHYLKDKLAELGFKSCTDQPFFNEFLTESPIEPKKLEKALADKGILMGLIEGERILWCATECNGKDKIDKLVEAIKEVL